MLTSKHLYAGYHDRMILNDVSVTIEPRKMTVILGANGSGKSTLLKSFARLVPKVSGEIYLKDQLLAHYTQQELARNISYLPQSVTLPSTITVFDLVLMGRFPYKKWLQAYTTEDYKIVEDTLNRLSIAHLKDSYVHELSGGQRQRTLIAMVLAQQTNCILLDEPTTYLDIAYQIELLEQLRLLQVEQQITIVMVLHDINLAARYADCLITMKDGRIVTTGAPSEVVTEEMTRLVYGLDSVVMEDPVYCTPMIVPKKSF